MTLQATGIADMMLAVRAKSQKGNWVDLTSDLQEHVGWNMLSTKGKPKFVPNSHTYQWQILKNHNDAAKHVGLLEQDESAMKDGAVQASNTWRHSVTSWAVEEHLATMNSASEETLFDWMKQQRHMGMIALAELMEAAFWGVPAADDEVTPFGVKYYIVPNATDGFTGAAASGYTTVANVNPTTVPRYKNYSFKYTVFTKADFVKGLKKAYTKCQFKPPIKIPTPVPAKPKYGLYCGYDMIEGISDIGEGLNENIGKDLQGFQGDIVFRGIPFQYVPTLDADTGNVPLLGIDWSVLEPVFLQGWWFKESPPLRKSGQHTVHESFVDVTQGLRCYDRRRLFCGTLSTGSGW